MNRLKATLRRVVGWAAALLLLGTVGGLENFRIGLGAGAAICAVCLVLITAVIFTDEKEG